MYKTGIVRIIIALLGIIILSSCARMNNGSINKEVVNSNPTESVQQSPTATPVSNDVSLNNDIEDFKKEFSSMIDKKTSPIEIKKLLEANANNFSSSEITGFFEELLSYMEAEADEQDKLIFSEKYGDLTWKFSEYISNPEDFEKIDNIEYRNIIKNIYDRGFFIPLYEGYYPQVDVDYYSLFDDFKSLLTKEYSTYFNLAYFDDVFGAEGILVATVDELTDSIHMYDMFLSKYPNSKYESEIEGYYEFRLYMYLQPLPEYGAVEENDVYTFGNEQIENYKKVISEYKNTQFAKVVNDYLKILEQNNYVDNKEVQDFRAKYGG